MPLNLKKTFKMVFDNPHHDQHTRTANPDGQRLFANAVYYPNWRVYKGQPPSSLNLKCITHVFYAFVWPTEEGSLALSDQYADLEKEVDGVQGALMALQQLKATYPYLKTILSIGGGGKGSESFVKLAAHGNYRQTFASNTKTFLDKYGFDGVDIDWEHPSDRKQGSDYVHLLSQLRAVLPTDQYILTSALPAGEWALRHIDLKDAAAWLDFVNVMAYDFAGPWTQRAGHHAQLRTPKHPHDDAARVSGSGAVEYFISKRVPSEKILLGIPAYGRSFLGAKSPGDSFSGSAGDEGTFEYRDLPRPDATEQVDKEAVAAYSIGGDGGFVTYDNETTTAIKAGYAREHNLGGVFFWTGTGDKSGEQSLVARSFKTLNQS